MGINFNRVGDDDYVAYLKNGKPAFEEEQPEVRQETVPVDKKPAGATDPINKKGLTVEANPADEDPVTAYNKKAQEILNQSEQTLKNLGIKPKKPDVTKLHHTNPLEPEFKTPETVEEAKAAYRQMKLNGQTDMTDEEIDEQAKLYIQNKERKGKFESTHTFLDKAEYKKAEAEKDAYYKELREQGLSRKEAKAKAYEKFGENKYLSNGGLFGIGRSSARRFIERNQDLFYEDGKFSEEKLDDYVLEQAQRGNQDEGEATNYRYSLKERRVATEQQRLEGRRTTVHQQGKVAKAAGMSTENNNTLLYSAGATAATFGAGAILQATTGISGAIGQFNACGQLCKGVTFPLGLPIYIKDPGEKIKHVKDIKPQIPPVEVPPEQPVVPPVEVPPEQPTVCPERPETEKVCEKTVQRGSSWAYYAENSGITINGKKPAGKVLNAYLYAQQLMYGIKNPKGLKENRFLPVGSKYVQHSDFSKLFENAEIMNKYGNILNVLKDADINVDNCVDLNGPVRGRRNPNFRYGGNVTGNTTIRTNIYDCDNNLIRVEDK